MSKHKHHHDGENLRGIVKCENCGSHKVSLKDYKGGLWLAGVMFIAIGILLLIIPPIGILSLLIGWGCMWLSKKFKYSFLICQHCHNMNKITVEEAEELRKKPLIIWKRKPLNTSKIVYLV